MSKNGRNAAAPERAARQRGLGPPLSRKAHHAPPATTDEIEATTLALIDRIQPNDPDAFVADIGDHLTAYAILFSEVEGTDAQKIERFTEQFERDMDLIVAAHHPAYQDDAFPLARGARLRLVCALTETVFEILFGIPPETWAEVDTEATSNPMAEDFSACWEQHIAKVFTRYEHHPFGPQDEIREFADALRLALEWLDRWQLTHDQDAIAYHVHEAYRVYRQMIEDDLHAPAPPPDELMGPRRAEHFLCNLSQHILREDANEGGADELLDKVDQAILQALKRYPPHATVVLYDLAAAADCNEKTCGKHVNQLIESGALVRKSTRGGVALTDKGRGMLRTDASA